MPPILNILAIQSKNKDPGVLLEAKSTSREPMAVRGAGRSKAVPL